VGPQRRFKPDDRRRLKKLTFKLKFLREELREHQDQHDFFRLEIIDVLHELRKYLGMDAATPAAPVDPSSSSTSLIKPELKRGNIGSNIDSEQGEESPFIEDPELHKMRVLYRKIAMLTHPDKLQHMHDLDESEVEDRIQIYKQASEALANRLMGTLVELAIYLGVNVEMPVLIKIRRIEDQVSRINGKIKELEESVEWLWGAHGDNDAVRVRIIGAVCQHAGCRVPDDSTIISFLKELDKRRDDTQPAKRVKRKVGERPKKTKR